jgi:hypothetical protein
VFAMGIVRRSCIALVVLCGCNPTPAATGSNPVATCASAGPTCIYAPGKLGRCVERSEPCQSGANCFVCQSQH